MQMQLWLRLTKLIRIIDIPEEIELEVEERVMDGRSVTSALIKVMRKLTDNEPAILAILEQFPEMIAAIDQPTKEMKAYMNAYTLTFANNLTKSELEFILDEQLDYIIGATGNNKEIIETMLTTELALELMSDYNDPDVLKGYENCKCVKDAIIIHKLENL